jgi:hypothetical protein
MKHSEEDMHPDQRRGCRTAGKRKKEKRRKYNIGERSREGLADIRKNSRKKAEKGLSIRESIIVKFC